MSQNKRITVTGKIDGFRSHWDGDAFHCYFRANDGVVYAGRFPGSHVSRSQESTVSLVVSHEVSDGVDRIAFVKNVRAVKNSDARHLARLEASLAEARKWHAEGDTTRDEHAAYVRSLVRKIAAAKTRLEDAR